MSSSSSSAPIPSDSDTPADARRPPQPHGLSQGNQGPASSASSRGAAAGPGQRGRESYVASVLPSSGGGMLDVCAFFTGWWKRQLEWRDFGGAFEPFKNSNTIVHVEEIRSIKSNANNPTQNTMAAASAMNNVRYLQWSFGRAVDVDTMHFGYVLRFTSPQSKAGDDDLDTRIEWQYNGRKCSGVFQPGTAVMVLNFFLPHTCVVITYRIVDFHTVYVCIMEVERGRPPTVQLGTMTRVNPARYGISKAASTGMASAAGSGASGSKK